MTFRGEAKASPVSFRFSRVVSYRRSYWRLKDGDEDIAATELIADD
jgi:hypothetical protein